MLNHYIFTEIYNCGKIGRIALQSFHKHHNLPVNIFGTKEDFKWIEPNDNNLFIDLDNPEIIEGYKQGHLGTAILWEQIIKESDAKHLIHFDSDVIFRENVMDDIIEYTKEYDLIGAIRNYKNNPFRDVNYSTYDDVVATGCFSFNKQLISNWPKEILIRMIQGTFNPLGHPVLDFFDPVSFDILRKGGKIKFLKFSDFGGYDGFTRNNGYEFNDIPNVNSKIEFGSKFAHFSAVGSGMNFFNNVNTNVPKPYKDYAIKMYAIYCKIFYNEDLGIDLSGYEKLIDYKEWFSKGGNMIKQRDEFNWPVYTKEYSRQINGLVSKGENTLLVKNFKVENGEVIFDDKEKIHNNWKELYSQVVEKKIKSVFECGCGSGQHLVNISYMNPDVIFAGCDLLDTQLKFGKEIFNHNQKFMDNITIMDFSEKDAYKKINNQYELVYSQAVVMHLSTEKAERFVENMMNLTSKYVLLIERPNDHDFKTMFDNILKRNNHFKFSFSYTQKYINTGILLTKI